jgi:hypothetical protein
MNTVIGIIAAVLYGAIPPAPELPQVGYRDGVCAHCGHAIERKERAA